MIGARQTNIPPAYRDVGTIGPAQLTISQRICRVSKIIAFETSIVYKKLALRLLSAEGYESMKKRISILTCLVLGLVLFIPPQRTSAVPTWMENYGSCMQTNFESWGGFYVTREDAIEDCDAMYPVPPTSNQAQNDACKAQAWTNWWNSQSNSSSIFGNCVTGVAIDYFALDFCDNALNVYDACYNTFQCEAMDPEEQFICQQDRWTCTSGSGIDRCR